MKNRKNDVPGVLPATASAALLAGERIVNSAVRCTAMLHEGNRVECDRYSNAYQTVHGFGSLVSVSSHIHSSDCFFPASGNRNNNNGDLNNVGSNGNYWSASPNDNNARNLNFNSNNLNSPGNDNNNRANGYSVRCSKAFTPFFLSIPPIFAQP